MTDESPQAVFGYILTHLRDMPPRRLLGESDYQQEIQTWFGGRLAANFEDFFMLGMILRHNKSVNTFQIPTALIVNDDAYIYMDHGLNVLTREADGLWKLHISSSMCWGCFGDHSFPGGECWGILCQCCGGTGWENGDLEYCACHELPVDLHILTVTNSPREAFLRFQEKQLPALQTLKDIRSEAISPALIRGNTAKIEVATPTTRYFALMRKLPTEQWHLSAILPLCSVCGGTGQNPADRTLPCPTCAGLKWGRAGELMDKPIRRRLIEAEGRHP